MTETNTAIYPITRYHKYNPLSKPAYNSLLEGSSASTVETIPSPSLYYNHFSLENFDVILHPEVTSPAIQYTLKYEGQIHGLSETGCGKKRDLLPHSGRKDAATASEVIRG